MNRSTRTLAVMGSILGLFVTSGNAVAQPAKAKNVTTFIGTLPAEPPARVAIVVEGDTFLAYACGQTDDFNKSASAWFKGTIKNGSLEATIDGKQFSATLANGTIRGSLTAEDKKREFTAKPVSPTAIAGLYRATKDVMGDTLVMGWIVDAKHQVVGGCHAKKREPFALQPVKPLPPPLPPAEEPKPEVKQEAEESLIGQVELEPGVSLQGEKVTSAVNPPAGKVVSVRK